MHNLSCSLIIFIPIKMHKNITKIKLVLIAKKPENHLLLFTVIEGKIIYNMIFNMDVQLMNR